MDLLLSIVMDRIGIACSKTLLALANAILRLLADEARSAVRQKTFLPALRRGGNSDVFDHFLSNSALILLLRILSLVDQSSCS